jgi:dihydrofolate synthase / folylpolyglutamate synthase
LKMATFMVWDSYATELADKEFAFLPVGLPRHRPRNQFQHSAKAHNHQAVSGKEVQADHVDDPDYQEALGFLYDRINYEKLVKGTSRYPFRLQRMRELLRRLDLGHYLYSPTAPTAPRQPLVHVAGTKGKGSTSTMVAAILAAAGLKTGLYTSPHLHLLEERFRVDGQLCIPDDLVSLVQQVKPVVAAITESHGAPSFFELTTAIALLHFAESACDAVVLEVGLGGRLDSTNVCAPSVCAVTSIGLDHQHVLGETLPEIAKEKAGIMKNGVPVVSGVLKPEAAKVISDHAAQVHAPLYQLGRDFDYSFRADPDWGSTITFQGSQTPLQPSQQVSIALEGEHQARNAAVALAICDLLCDQGVSIPGSAATSALRQLQCPGRIERFLLPDGLIGIIDAAHNEDSIAALCQCLASRRGVRPIHVVFGTSMDKVAEPMLKQLAEVADQLVLTRYFGNPRFRSPEQLQPLVPSPLSASTKLITQPIQACEYALESLRQVGKGGYLVVCGSFFLAAETREWMAAVSHKSA